MLLMKESVLILKKKQHNLGLPTFKLPASTKHFLRIVFSCLYLPQWHYISYVLCGYEVLMNMNKTFFGAKVHL